jgi:hypothetical protein
VFDIFRFLKRKSYLKNNELTKGKTENEHGI